MAEANKTEFHARLERVGDLYRANYRADPNPSTPVSGVEAEGPQIWTDSHVGTDPAAVRTWVESLAKNRGYARVVWEA